MKNTSLPPQLIGELFEAVQQAHLFPDSKTFVDAEAKRPSEEIMSAFKAARQDPLFDLKAFVDRYFSFPDRQYTPLIEHINSLWPKLARQADSSSDDGTTLIPLQYPYIVPGGRFGEIFYWDSYYTSVGLIALRHTDNPELKTGLPEGFDPEIYVEGMLANYKQLLRQLGLIPNGNRLYFQHRSQPPHLALYVELLWELKYARLGIEQQKGFLKDNLAALHQEWQFWMRDRVVEVELEGHIVKLNRYGSNTRPATPREESYVEDMTTTLKAGWSWANENAREGLNASATRETASDVMHQLRAGAESGWDFSSRWLADSYRLSTIQTTHYLPVDLNCLLYKLETVILEHHQLLEGLGESVLEATTLEMLNQQKQARRKALDQLFWSEELEFYCDYNHVKGKRSPILAISGVAPLFAGATDPIKARQVGRTIQARFLAPGGVRTTLEQTGQQWDGKNGWAPLQWQAVKGLYDCGIAFQERALLELAETIKLRWLETLRINHDRDHHVLEKYDVDSPTVEAGGGEYDVQQGFGWTNGVALALLDLSIDTF